jgi:hypothetical protein
MAGMIPLALSGEDWAAIGSLGTALSVFVAAVSLLIARGRSQESKAAQIRQRVQVFATATHRLVALLKEGSPLISAAWHTAHSLRTQAGEQATADGLRHLIGDSSAALTAAVEGWASSQPAAELRGAFAELMASGRGLPGYLSVFWPTAVLLQKMADDGYSNTIFIKLLTDEPAQQFVLAHGDDDLDALTRSLAAHLHGNASSYFLLRYKPALDGVLSFVDTAASALADLESGALVRADRAKLPITAYETYTGELRDKTARLSGLLPPEALGRLDTEISVIEAAISKDSAIERAEAERKGESK